MPGTGRCSLRVEAGLDRTEEAPSHPTSPRTRRHVLLNRPTLTLVWRETVYLRLFQAFRQLTLATPEWPNI